jgi:pimeloyl-ACP methyl ester carboxylesterase
MTEPKLVQFTTEDGLRLPGYLYEASQSKKAAIYLHGNGSASVFYSKDFLRELAAPLAQQGISSLFFNNRGAHYIKSFHTIDAQGEDTRTRFGTSYEKIKDCVYDIDGAIAYLETLGYTEFYLIGTSTGANKICVYDHYKPYSKISKYILLGAGDDTGIYYDILGKEKFYRLLAEAQEKIQAGKGDELIQDILPEQLFSYAAFFDMANPDGDYNTFPFHEALHDVALSSKPLFRYFKAMKKSALVIYGEHDEYAWGDVPAVVALLKKEQPMYTYEIVPGADHALSEHKKEIGELMSRWLIR